MQWIACSLLFISLSFSSQLWAKPDAVRVRINDVIEVVPMDEYVYSVLVNEMPLSWPLETLKAQTIAIRSYTEATVEERKNRAYQLESSVLDQVYKKISGQGRNPALLEKARQAVSETEGIVLRNQKGQVLKAYYHSDCGGRTVLASSVWKQGKDMDAGTAVDPSCPSNPSAQWSFEMPKEKFVRLVKNFFGDIRSNDFRQILGFTNLKSTDFEVLDKEDRIEFVGQGFGHRVGMCQWGSRALGLKGFTHQRILKHYYPLANLSSLSENF